MNGALLLPGPAMPGDLPQPRLPANLLPNGDFEQGPAIWSQYSSNGYGLIVEFEDLTTSGRWAAWLGGADNEISQLGQSVMVPVGRPFLSYYHVILSDDGCNFDFARVKINGIVVDEITLCEATQTYQWVPYVVNLTAFAGRTVSLEFEVSTDGSITSSYFLDDVSFVAPPPPNAGWFEMPPGSASGSGISNNPSNSWKPSLAIGADGHPIVAWYDFSNSNWQIYVRRWNGSAWVEMGNGSASGGGISNNDGASWWPRMVIGGDGLPVVAWSDGSSGNNEIYVRRWNGSGWVEMGTGSASGGGISRNDGDSVYPFLAIGTDGFPVVAWSDNSSGDFEIYIRRWNGSGWVEMGAGSSSGEGVSKNAGDSEVPTLAIGADSFPVVAWSDNSSGDYEIYVRRWNGSSWVEMGSSSATGGGISNNVDDSFYPSLTISADGRPVVAWSDGDQGVNVEVYVRRWNGSAWVEMGRGSASGGGISNSADNSWVPSLAIGTDGHPIVAWKDWSDRDSHPYTSQIYIRRWNGSAWIEVGGGSANSGGISNNAGNSDWPSLAIGRDGLPIVAWNDFSGGDSEIYVRKGQRIFAAFAPTVSKELCLGRVVELEPNNSSRAANGPVCSGRVYSGLPNDDLDMFYIDTTRTADLSAVLTNHAGSGVQLQLYYGAVTNGTLVASDQNPSDGFRIDHRGPAGRYYVVIFARTPNPSTTSRYSLVVEAR